jgi:hypothetical protein
MKQLIRKYEGGDCEIVITREEFEALGIHPGDEFTYTIRPVIEAEETATREEIEGILDELARALPDAKKDSEREIRKVWDKLKPPSD